MKYLCNHCAVGITATEVDGWVTCQSCDMDLDVATLVRLDDEDDNDAELRFMRRFG